MGINIKCPVRAEFLEKWITVGKMKEVLSEMEDQWELLPNSVGNLSVYTPPPENRCVGYIDVSGEQFHGLEPDAAPGQ